MKLKLLLVFAISVALPVAATLGQDDATASPTVGDGQLPPVVVDGNEDGNELPAVVVQPNIDSFNEQNYPDLSNKFLGSESPFDQSGGVLRGATSLFDTPAAASITSRQDITEKQSSDMFSALQNEVGVLMQSTAAGQASPFIRGLTGQQVLILIDGIRLNNSVYRFGPNQYFNTIDPGSVDHIEVLRGQGSVLWGSDAIGGAINVVTRGADSHRGRFHGDYRQGSATQYFNTADSGSYTRFNVEGWVGQGGLFAGGSYSNNNDLDTGFDFGRQPGTNYSQFSGDVKYNYLIDENQLLTFSLQHYEQEQVPRSDRFPGFPGDLNNSNNNGGARFFDPQQRDLAYVRYQALDPIPVLDALTVTGSYHRQRETQTRGIPETRFQETDVESVGVNLVGVRDMREFGKVTVGADWYHDDVDSDFGGAASGPIVPDDAYYERLGIFLNWDVQVTERLNAVAGVRYETIDLAATADVGGPVFISPSYDDFVGQVGFSYELNPCARLVGSISEGFRAPNLDELTANNPNVLQNGQDLPSLGLTPEHSVNYEIGIKTDYHNLRTQTFVFWTDLGDNIVPISAGANQFTRANQDSFIQGIEFQGEYLLEGGWSTYGNFWYTYGRNEVTGDPLSRIPPMQGIAGLRWRDPQRLGHFAIYTWLVDNQNRLDPVRDLGDERIPAGGTPGYGTLNMQFSRAYGECSQHRVSLNLENITDRAYLVHGSGVFGTGFTARLGYSLDF
ncbi:MAG: hemoglobin/transferrin/lactoferrin receptor protein [Pirellulaceae bacterium]|jgi:hemoglobin/transferrin/lactoferrin receptor protein